MGTFAVRIHVNPDALSMCQCVHTPDPTLVHVVFRKTKFATVAQTHRNEVCNMLGNIEESLSKQATQHCPRGDDSRKRKSNSFDDVNRRPFKKVDTKTGGDMSMVEREAKAMKDLANYIEEVGGKHFQSRLLSCKCWFF